MINWLKTYKSRIKVYTVLVLLDACSVALSMLVSMWVKFDFTPANIHQSYVDEFFRTVWIWAPFYVIVFALMRLYNNFLSFASVDILLRVFASYAVISATMMVAYHLDFIDLAPSYYIITIVINFILTATIHFACRVLQRTFMNIQDSTAKALQ